MVAPRDRAAEAAVPIRCQEEKRMTRHVRHWRLGLGRVLVAVPFLLGMLPAATAFAAAPAQPARPATVTELSKIVLDETSINAPGFYGNAQISSKTVIAWAGTDPDHHLNVMTSTDGLDYGSKVILNDLSANRPGVVRMSDAAGGAVAIAWRGTDAAHRLNVMFDVYGSRKKLILNETSFTGPAITVWKGNLLIAWAGTDTNHSLKVMPIALASLTPGPVTTLWQFSASAGPNLTVFTPDGGVNSVALSWARSTSLLDVAISTDGVHFTSGIGNSLPETGPSSPGMLQFHTEGGPENWIAWTGTDSLHHLNVKWTHVLPTWTGNKTILPELGLGGPQLGFNQGVLIAWTGTDPEHHLNVARLQGF
jgi:hypothetical protein